MDKLANLGIDLRSIVLYLANTGVLLVVLTYLLYKPIFKFIDERRHKIESSIDEAQRLRDEFAKRLEESEKAKDAVEATLREELANMQRFTEQKRAELTKEMDEKRVDMLQKAQMEIDKKKDALLKDAEAEVKRLMTAIILDVVENKVPEDVIQASVKDAWKTHSK